MRIKPIDLKIGKVYRSQTIDCMLLAWVEACKTTVPSCTITQACILFAKHWKISEDDVPLLTLEQNYKRLKKEVLFEK